MPEFNANRYIDLMQNGIEKELPSGLKFHFRPVDQGQLLTSKRIPDNLLRVVRDMMKDIQRGKDENESEEEAKKRFEKEFKNNPDSTVTWFINAREYGAAVAFHSILSPKIVEGDPQNENEFSIDWFPTEDLNVIGQWVGVPLVELESFRFKTTADVEPVQPSKTDLPDTEQDLRDESVLEEPVHQEEPPVGNASDIPSDDSLPVRSGSRNLRRIR